MKEQQHNAKDILRRYVNGQCTEEERLLVEEWYKEHYDSNFKINTILAEEHLTDIWQELSGEMKRRKIWSIRKITAIAASVAIIVGLGIFYVHKTLFPTVENIVIQKEQNAIEAGRDQALLTLSDGTEIHLDSVAVGDVVTKNGMIITKMDGGTLIYKTAPSEQLTDDTYNTISTPRGGQYKIILPDNSVVWLNAASSLRFPVAFGSDTRLVELVGEAYFEVAHDTKRSFIVSSQNQQTIVKGTKFNIAAYPDGSEMTTTLLEGSVLVKSMYTDDILLRPNEQAVLQNNSIYRSAVDATEVIAWKNGKFIFNNTPLQDIMQQLARWYDIEVLYAEPVEGITFTGSVSRSNHIQDILRKISLTESIQFEIKGRRVMVQH